MLKNVPPLLPLQGTKFVYFIDTLHKLKFRQKFSLSYIYTSSKWYSQHLLNFGQESKKKMHLNFGTSPQTGGQPHQLMGHTPENQRAGKVKRSWKGFFLQFMNLVHRDQGWGLWQGVYSSSNWHRSLPSLAGPASVPCSTVQQTGITFQSLGHSVQTHGSRT